MLILVDMTVVLQQHRRQFITDLEVTGASKPSTILFPDSWVMKVCHIFNLVSSRVFSELIS